MKSKGYHPIMVRVPVEWIPRIKALAEPVHRQLGPWCRQAIKDALERGEQRKEDTT